MPLTREIYQQPDQWVQMRGDPAICGGLFYQQRIESPMGQPIDEVLDLVTELIAAHGVFHGKLHFSSHYMPWGQLLEKSLGFWLGTGEPAMDEERQENCQQSGGGGKDAYTNTARSN